MDCILKTHLDINNFHQHNNKQPWWFALIYCPIFFFVLIALFLVSCRDPGLMERVTEEDAAEQGWFWNEQVGSYRPAGAMYCREGKVSSLECFDCTIPFHMSNNYV